MIVKLAHTRLETAKKIRTVFQDSYAIEAKLLNAIDFPPLQRSMKAFLDSKNEFYGVYQQGVLIAVTEVENKGDTIHIQSLVVDPHYFRQGFASALLTLVLATYDSKLITVETGLANEPAKGLYRSFGFLKTKEWDTDHGVRKVAFELSRKL